MLSIMYEEYEGRISNVVLIIDEDPKNHYPIEIPEEKRRRFVEEFEGMLKMVEEGL